MTTAKDITSTEFPRAKKHGWDKLTDIDFRLEQTKAYPNTINYFYTEEELDNLARHTNPDTRHLQNGRRKRQLANK